MRVPSVMALVCLSLSGTASADWWDYTDAGFDPLVHPQTVVGVCNPGAPHGCPSQAEVNRHLIMEHDDGDRYGIVFLHGMGRRCAPAADLTQPPTAPAYERIGLRVYDGLDLTDPRWNVPTFVPSGELPPMYAGTPGVALSDWLMEPHTFPSGETEYECTAPDYWSAAMLEQVAAIGDPQDGTTLRVPTLAAGWDGEESWETGALTVARQVNAFVDHYDLDRVTVIAHSMGGVVLRDLFTQANRMPSPEDLEIGPDWEFNDAYAIHRAAAYTTRVITLASPQGGSVAAELAYELTEPALGDALEALILQNFVTGLAPIDFILEELVYPLVAWILNGWGAQALGVIQLNPADWLGYDDDATRSARVRFMTDANRGRLYGTPDRPPLNVAWHNGYGRYPMTLLDEEDNLNGGYVRNRDRQFTCRGDEWSTGGNWEDYLDGIIDPFAFPTSVSIGLDVTWGLACGPDIKLELLHDLSRTPDKFNESFSRRQPSDGMVFAQSARLVGSTIVNTHANHNHIRFGDTSYSVERLDLIGHLRYYAHADAGDTSARFEDTLAFYDDPLTLPDFGSQSVWTPPTVPKPQEPTFARPRVGTRSADCTTTSVVGTLDQRVSHTGRFDLLLEQRYLPAAEDGRTAWPVAFDVQITRAATGGLPTPEGFREVGVHEETALVRIANPVPNVLLAGAIPISLPLNLNVVPSEPAGEGLFGGVSGEYTFSVRACTAAGACSELVPADEAVTVELDAFVNPASFTNQLACNNAVIGGRMPIPGAAIQEALDADALELIQNNGNPGIDSPNTWDHVLDPIWSQTP